MNKSKITNEQFLKLRNSPLSTVGVMLTDKCPVGCSHCSVSSDMSLKGSSTNPKFFKQLNDFLSFDAIKLVVVTGGEPFVNLQELLNTVKIIKKHKKKLAVHTSAYWGNTNRQRDIKLKQILTHIDTMVLGVDLFHRSSIADNRLISALRQIKNNDIWIVIQVIEEEENKHFNYATSILETAFDFDWSNFAEIIKIKPLPYGRAKNIGWHDSKRKAGKCSLVNGPVLRFDNRITACCNEAVLKQKGPKLLEKSLAQQSAATALEKLSSELIVELVRNHSIDNIFEVLSSFNFFEKAYQPISTCEGCWKLAELISNATTKEKNKIALITKIL